jgi:GT2 family glycosyltransferase
MTKVATPNSCVGIFAPPVSIVIPTYNRKKKLMRLIESILQSDYPNEKLEIIVVDDASPDKTYEEVKNAYPMIRYIRHEKEELVAKSINDGIIASSNEFILICDDDNVIDKSSVRILIETLLADDRIGVVGPVTYYLDQPNVIQCAGCKYGSFTRITYHLFSGEEGVLRGRTLEVDAIPNCFMVKRSLALKVGLIPARRIPWNGEDGYLQYKIKKLGYKIVVVGDAKVYHDSGREHLQCKPRLYQIPDKFRHKPNLLYYALRSKIIFHKDLDTRSQFLTFLLSLPIYIAFYSYIAIHSNRKLASLKAVFDGLIDGLLCKESVKPI